MKEIYLDNCATTPLSPAARKALLEALDIYGNPSSLHALGQSSRKLVESSRETLLRALGVKRGEGTLVFTSCGSEATSMALFGTARAKERREANVIISSDSEHPATLRALEELEKEGFEIIKIATVGGVLDRQGLEEVLSNPQKKVFMATFMLVNNETGAVYDVRGAFDMIKKKYPSAITHVDAIQGFMKLDFTPASLGADLISLSGHKIHAPKGVGALYVSKDLIRAKRIIPFLVGGGQESGLRSGTENLYGIAAFATAAEDILPRRKEIREHFASLYSRLEGALEGTEIVIKKPMGERAFHIVNLTLPSIKSETMLHFLSAKGIYVSSGSACSSRATVPSHALLAFGATRKEADASLRVSFSEYTTEEDIDALTGALKEGVTTLVRMR